MKTDISILKKVLNLPTAPFHEEFVCDFIKNFCRRLGVACKSDRYGNLKVIYKKGRNKKGIAFEAHTDHPGFEVIRGGKNPVVQLLGGVPDRFFKKAKVIVWNEGKLIKAKVGRIVNKRKRQYQLFPSPQPPPTRRGGSRSVSLPPGGGGLGRGGFGYFDLPGLKIKKGIIHTKAADDLINVALLLNFLKELVRRKAKTHVQFIFTRAEEVGFVGASGALRTKLISKKIPILVLEASNAKAGKVTIGGGPVLRVGDRASTFSHEIDLWLQHAAARLTKKSKGFCFQRALLSGGRCESTVYMEKGCATGCLAFPLGNYHNIGKKNYASEFVSLKDYQNILAWLWELSQSPAPSVVAAQMRGKIDLLFKRYAGRLKNISNG